MEKNKKRVNSRIQCHQIRLWRRPYLKPQQVVHGADDDVDRRGVSRLSPQEVLEV